MDQNKKSPTVLEHLLTSVAISLLIAAVFFLVSVFVLTTPSLNKWVVDSRIETIGPYQMGLIGILVALILLSSHKIYRFLAKIWKDDSFTLIDNIILSSVIWGIAWCLYWNIPQLNQSIPIDWGQLTWMVTIGNILFWISLIWICSKIYKSTHKTEQISSEIPGCRLFRDDPIERKEGDFLKREKIVNEVVNIIKLFDRQGSLVLAITGPWGEGKTTVINFVLNELENRKDIIFVKFEPWHFSVGNHQGIESIIRNFFTTLDSAIQRRVFRPSLSQLLKRYSEMISPVLHSNFPISLDLAFRNSPPDLLKLYEEIDKKIGELNATVLITIDDLDRMASDEILYVFKLVHLCAKFKNVIYILGLDLEFVETQLAKQFNHSSSSTKNYAREYINKIVNLSFALPKLDPQLLSKNALQKYLKDIEGDLRIPLLQDAEFSERFEHAGSYIITLLSNVRLVKLFLNQYWHTLPQVIGEVNYFDLFVIELIHLMFPWIYQEIYDHPSHFTPQIDPSIASVVLENDDATKVTFDSLLQKVDNDNKNKAINYLLGAIFPLFRTYERKSLSNPISPDYLSDFQHRSIADAYHFPRYFIHAVQQGTLSNVEWEHFIEQVNGTLSADQVDELISQSATKIVLENIPLEDWLQRLRASVPRIELSQVEPLILSIVKNSYHWQQELKNAIIPYALIAFLISDLLDHHLHSSSSNRIDQSLIKKIVASAPDITLIQTIYVGIINQEGHKSFEQYRNHSNYKPIMAFAEKLKHFAAMRLKEEYIKSNRDIFQDNHTYKGIYALRTFLEPDECRIYIRNMINNNHSNAIDLIEVLLGDAGLNYKTLRELAEPELLFRILNEPTIQVPSNYQWIIGALKQGIEIEKVEGKIPNRFVRDPSNKAIPIFD